MEWKLVSIFVTREFCVGQRLVREAKLSGAENGGLNYQELEDNPNSGVPGLVSIYWKAESWPKLLTPGD